MKIKNVNLETVCGVTSTLPKNDCPEYAFAGKSNVGKSSLINGLMNRKSYAKISQTPGKTRTINYYRINGEFYFVDLPGYGYAGVSLEAKKGWGHMIEKYLRTSRQLRLVFLLVDIRHAPGENDRIMYDWIERSGYRPVVLATKQDKIKKSQIHRQCGMIRETLGMGDGDLLIPWSARTRQGREEICAVIDASQKSGLQGEERG